jgi:uncharacterized protein
MSEQGPEKQNLPFNNLFLNSGAAHGHNQWWMYVAGISAAMLGYFIFQIIIQIPLVSMAINQGISIQDLSENPNIIFDPEKLGINKNIMLAMLFGMFVFALLGLYLVVTKIHQKPFLSLISSYEKIRFKRIFFAFAVWGVLITAATLIGYFNDKESVTVQFDPVNFFTLLAVTLIFMPIQTGTEEIIFRGYLLQGLSLVFKNGLIPVIITSLLFGMVHMTNPEAQAFGWLVMLPYYAAFGLFLGLITLLDEGLELALGIHCANNIISSLLVTSPNSVLKTDAIFMAKTENPKAEIALWVVLAIVTFIIFLLKYRWKNFNLIVK